MADPLGRPVEARFLLLADGTAVVEAAAAIGLPLLADDERDPLRASSRGFGELLLAALEESPRRLLVALGGTATMDGGVGAARGRGLASGAGARAVRRADAAGVRGPRLRAAEGGFALGRRRSRTAAGGDRRASTLRRRFPAPARPAGSGLRSRRSEPSSFPGRRRCLDLVGFDAQLAGCDLVVTGEGRVDATTVEGKAPGEVARRAAAAGVRCVVFGGEVELDLDGVETVALSGDPARAEADLVELGGRLGASVRGLPRR